MLFNIEVQDRRNGSFRHRTTVEAADANAALHEYLPSIKSQDRRPRLGYGKSAKGKQFRAVQA